MACTCSRNRQCPRAGLWFLVHWLDSACRFDAKTLEVRTHICPVMNVEQPYCPQVCFTLTAAQCMLRAAQCQEYDCALSIMCEPPLQGHFIHVLPCTPCSNVNVEFGVPWWRDSQYRVRYSSTILCVPCMPLSATLSAPSNDGASVRCVRPCCFLMSRSDVAPQCTMSGALAKATKMCLSGCRGSHRVLLIGNPFLQLRNSMLLCAHCHCGQTNTLFGSCAYAPLHGLCIEISVGRSY